MDVQGISNANYLNTVVTVPAQLQSAPTLAENANLDVHQAATATDDTLPQAKAQMKALFAGHLANVRRPLKPELALQAYKLRRQGKAEHRKNVFSRFRRIAPEKSSSSRSSFNKQSEQKFRQALNRDFALAEKGWSFKGAGGIEGVHSTAARMVTATSAGIAVGAGGPLVGLLLHEVPSLLINPALSGVLRVITQVEQIILRKGGAPTITGNIRGARTMDRINVDMKAALATLKTSIGNLKSVGPEDYVDALTQAVARAFIKADMLQTEYTERAEIAKIEHYGKAWGAAVNAVGVASTGLAFHNPVAALGLLGGAVLLQVGAGAVDEKNKQTSTIHGNAKYPAYMVPGAQYKPVDELTTNDVSTSGLKKAWADYPAGRFGLIRTIAHHRLAQAVEESLEIETNIRGLITGRHHLAGATYHIEKTAYEARLKATNKEIATLEQQIDAFEHLIETIESPGPADEIAEKIDRQLDHIDPNGLIGRCLQEQENYFCFRQGIDALLSAPGELSAQILQRYAQNLHAMFSIGIATGIHDIIGLLHGINKEASHIAEIALTSAMGAHFVANTGSVRVNKGGNKKKMAAPKQDIGPLLKTSEDNYSRTLRKENAALAKALDKLRPWVRFTSTGRVIDLTGTSACDRALNSRGSRLMRILKPIPAALVSGPVGAAYAISAKRSRAALKPVMEEAMRELQRHFAGKTKEAGDTAHRPQRTFGAIREAFIRTYPWEQSVAIYRELAGA